MELASLVRHPPASDLAAGRPSRRRGVPLRRLARGRRAVAGGRCCRSGRPTSSARRTAPPSAFAAWPALLAEPEAPVSARGDRGLRRAPCRTGSATGRASRAATRSPTRCGSSASGARCARTRAERGVRLIGDVPIYVSDEGADVAAWPELFAHGEVAGAPPDALSANGQHWGNPLYDWPAHRATGYRWWIERFRRDVRARRRLRAIDHFRGFVAYWAIPARHKTARDGRWRRGPGAALFHAVERAARRPAADRRGPRRDHAAGLPAARRARPARDGVLLWAFGERAEQPARAREPPRQPVVYTSTHDTDTAVGWFAALGRARSARRPGSTRGAELGPDRARAMRRGRARDRPGAGRARARQRGAHEPARRGRRATGRWRLEPGGADDGSPRGCAKRPRAVAV